MSIITKKLLEGKHFDGETLTGTILLKEYHSQLTKNDKVYVTGVLTSGSDVQFKAWDNSSAFDILRNSDISGCVVDISGRWSEYNGNFSVILNSVTVNAGVQASDFMPTKYNIDAYTESLKDLILKSCSEKGYVLACEMLFNNDELMNTFKVEFAARAHHDNCKGGLLAHTYKVCSLVRVALNMYDSLWHGDSDLKDLYILGALFHDLGKVREMHLGVYQKEQVVNHSFLGVEMLNKSRIVELYNEDWYYYLVSILLQHHGEYGENPKSICAYVVHLIDCLDAYVTDICQTLERGIDKDTVVRSKDFFLRPYNHEG